MSFQTTNLKIQNIPLNQIRRPIPPVLDNDKINSMVSTLNGVPQSSATCQIEDIIPGELPPVDVFQVREKGKNYFFAFGGCHRFQAYDTKGGETLVRCKILPATRSSLKVYLGGSVDAMFE